jgi:hypothetical protein
MNIAKFLKRSIKNRFIISIILYILIPIFIIFIILHLFNFNLNNKLRFYEEFIKNHQQYLYEKINVASIDQETANQEQHEDDQDDLIFQSKFLKSLKDSIRNNSSEQIIDNNKNKVAIKFRLTDIYRIGIHQFTKTFKIFG